MKKTIYLYVSIIILAVLATFLGYKTYQSFAIGIVSCCVVLIPVVYSVIPLIKEQKQKYYSNKNRITNSIFTDREEDLKDIIRILNIQEHCVQITGTEQQCGKSWMAKRLCDYINFPKDSEFKGVGIKCTYLKADYIDMDKYNEKEFNDYFTSNNITPKTVLIFDNVDNFELIWGKQKLFHFQMVYILKEGSEPLLSTHMMSNFQPQHIGKLQQKINESYPGICTLTQSEIDVLYRMTEGNIGHITALLSEQKCVSWIKDLAQKQSTEYEVELEKIEMKLLIGKYQDGQKLLDEFGQKYKKDLENNNHLAYLYYLILSDCEHLLNHYEEALDILSIVEQPVYKKYNNAFEIELHKAHYFKHIWRCNDSLQILTALKFKSFSAIVDTLGILLAMYFINDLHVPGTQDSSLQVFSQQFILATNSELPTNNNDLNKLKRNKPIYTFYNHKPNDETELINMIDDVIAVYASENNRLLANAYFIKVELYRMYQKYEKALTEYKRCTNITIDNNLKLQTNLIMYYLIKVKKLDLDFELMTDNEINNLCEHNPYSHIVRHRIRNIELDDSNAAQIQEEIDTRIMPIL